MRLLFCLFAEDTGLLPRRLFTRLVEQTRTRPEEFGARLRSLFAAMATGGSFGVEDIAHFNGGLFADDTVLGLTSGDMGVLARAGQLDWTSVEPAIFGTLFERSLDPQKRGQLGAHYTSKEDILLIVEPVLIAPLRRRWEAVQAQAEQVIARRDAASGGARTRHQQTLGRLLMGFAGEIASVRVLDPACGSGNFLYVALKRLLDLEKEVITFAATNGLTAFFPQVEPDQLYGIELNTYAHELAQVVVWIGYIQWLNDNGFGVPDHPILKPLNNILHMDAVLAYDKAGQPVAPEWPEADVIIGNPPFLGDKKMRTELGDKYVDDLRSLYSKRIPGQSDFVCYWFERARELIAGGEVRRAGLLATNSIRTGANRRTLDRIKETGGIFMAWADRPWVVEGADVRVSIVGFDGGTEPQRMLDNLPVAGINPDLTAAVNVTGALRLKENEDLSFIGAAMHGPFEITAEQARAMLTAPVNTNGQRNSDVIRPWLNGLDVTRRPRSSWVIDFGVDSSVDQAALYELPFEYVRKVVKPVRDQNRRLVRRTHWWRLGEPMPKMRSHLAALARFTATPRVAKHRIFVRFPTAALPSDQLVVFAREDDYFLGVLQSRVHELWAIRMCSWLGVGNDPRYTPSTIVETFPFPWPPGEEPAGDARVEAIAAAARELVERREQWLNPEGADEAELKQRTLTNLYNQRPAWLEMAHRRLDVAVFDAYGWPPDLSDEEILERLLVLNFERAGLNS